MTNLPISRRTVLKGLGVSMALPLLDAMLPKLALGQAAAQVFPRRLAVVYFPMGVFTRDWTMSATGAAYTLSKTAQPLAPYKSNILILSGLTADKARPHGDGGGDHARAQATFLTGKQARKSTTDIHIGVSMDYVISQRIGQQTRFPSLEIGCEGGRQSGGCDPGYSCAYTSNLSWRSESTPNPKETNPRSVFDRLFGSNNAGDARANQQRRQRYNQSILDFVLEDARSLNTQVGLNDQRRVDEYLTSIRELEHRITNFSQQAQTLQPDMRRPDSIQASMGFGPNAGGNADFRQHLRIMADLLTVAFQTDVTRIITHVQATEMSNRSYRFIDVPEGHHDISHHLGDPEKGVKFQKINQFHVEQFAYLLSRLKSVREGNGTLLDNCMILFGSGNGDGGRHNHDNLPIVLAGKGGGTLSPGRHLRYTRDTPLCNLHLELMDRMGVTVNSFGDSTGRLRNLS